MALQETRHVQTHVRVRIPKEFQQEPIISDVIRHYGVSVNIKAALLSVNACDDGWFDLELRGTQQQVDNSLTYWHDLNLEMWHDRAADHETW